MAFIDLTNVEIVDEVSEDAKALVVEKGEIKRAGMSKVSEMPSIIDTVIIKYEEDNNHSTSCNFTYDEIKEKIMNKEFFNAVLMKTLPDGYANDILIYQFRGYSVDSYTGNIILSNSNDGIQVTICIDNSILYYEN